MRGSKLFKFDFDSFSIGTFEHPTATTGCTVFRFKTSLRGAIDVRGGAVAVSDPTCLSLDGTWGEADGLVFAGGSTYGLAATVGVKDELLRERQSSGFQAIPSVPGAIVYDFSGRDDLTYPDAEMGRSAYKSAVANQVWIGAKGAGRNVSVGKIMGRDWAEASGQGAAFNRIGDVKIFSLSVVNAAGCILNHQGKVIAGHKDPLNGQRKSVSDIYLDKPALSKTEDPRGNTTISMFITNVALDRHQLHRLCTMTHMSLGRVIDPYASGSDGDVFFAFTTNEVQLPTELSQSALGALTARTAQEAVISAVQFVDQ